MSLVVASVTPTKEVPMDAASENKDSMTIGRAQGILMQRLSIRADSALQYLRSVATNNGQELADVAADIIRTRAPSDHD
jgi:AmiR/NasT family two-component response regulator